MIKTTNVFTRNLEAFNRGVPTIINEGGQGSSKTYSVLQLWYAIATMSKAPLIMSAVSESMPHLKLGLIRDFENILEEDGVNIDKIRNKTDRTYKINNSVIEFFSTEDHGKAHGPRRNHLFINEANGKGITYEIYTALAARTSGTVWIDYNPRSEFWVHEEVIPNEKHELIRSTFRDNPYLPEKERERILAKNDGKHENWWRVYGLGLVGQYEGCIFTNWSTGAFECQSFGFGLDFGFNDPDAMVKVGIDARAQKIYLDECIYENGLTTGQLADKILQFANRDHLIVADAAEARLIFELSSRFNIKPANKKSGSVSEGIRLMQDFELVVTPDSYNLIKELNNYVWSDKRAGIPEDSFNHLLDAIRYFCMYQLIKNHRRGITRRN